MGKPQDPYKFCRKVESRTVQREIADGFRKEETKLSAEVNEGAHYIKQVGLGTTAEAASKWKH